VSGIKLNEEGQAWLRAFECAHGRRPRILHIGNIANNAYCNAKLLNEAGIDCDVICYDYYHIMGCPEWEDADIEAVPADHFRPFWVGRVGPFERPRWFAQGPVDLCLNYLLARRKGRARRAEALWRRLAAENGTRSGARALPRLLNKAAFRIRTSGTLRYALAVATVPRPLAKLWKKLKALVPPGTPMRTVVIGAGFAVLAPVLLASRVLFLRRRRSFACDPDWDAKSEGIVRKFAEVFPARVDQLRKDDVELYGMLNAKWKDVLGQYDVVQAYATDPIIPLLAGHRTYVGFEHGTLRAFTQGDNAVCRLTSLAYNQAAHVFITNGDCLEYARRIGVTRHSPMLHPVDERKIRATTGAAGGLHANLGVRYLFLCTLRHDWSVKGTDHYIRALPGIAKSIGDDFKVLMTKWGADLEASMALARDLGVFDKIEWIDPLPKRALVQTQKSVDVLFDQIALPHFGATAPEAIAAGVPVIMSYDPASTAWLVPEPAPILSAWNADEVVLRVRTALDPAWRAAYREKAQQWIDRYHNAALVVRRHMTVYGELLAPRPSGAGQQ